MNELEVKSGDWVVVCDGRKALILENVGDKAFPTSTLGRFASTRTCPGEQGSGVPGRVPPIGRARPQRGRADGLA